MLAVTKELITTAVEHLCSQTSFRWVINASKHFEERMVERFEENEYELLERVIEKAVQNSRPGQTRYTHPYYKITVVINKMGLNGAELVTCWKEALCR